MKQNIAESFIVNIPRDIVNNPEIQPVVRELSRRYANHEVVTEELISSAGSMLWRALNIDASFDEALKEAGSKILPIVLQSDSAEIFALPWETLRHPELGFLGRSNGFTLSRRVSGEPLQIAEPPDGPLKVLLFTSLPDDLDAEKERLNTETEQENVIEALDQWIKEGAGRTHLPGRRPVFRIPALVDRPGIPSGLLERPRRIP